MQRAAVYRLLYGEDFIRESILSVLGVVDAVYVFWTDQPWGGVREVTYRGEVVQFPERFDNAREVIEDIGSEKIRLIEHYHPTPRNQFTVLVNDHVDADVVLLIEADQVVRDARAAFHSFEGGGDKAACLRQREFWKTPEYEIPYRNRPGPIFWRTPLSETGLNGSPLGFLPRMSAWADNYGFCVSDQAMYWKHLTAIAFSGVVGDSMPREEWLDDVWRNWHPGMMDLEISANHPEAISHAYPVR